MFLWTYPRVDPSGQKTPYIETAVAWFVESVISPRIDCMAAILPEYNPAIRVMIVP